MDAEHLSYVVVIAGFIVGALVNAGVWVYTYGKLQGRMEIRERYLDDKLDHLGKVLEQQEKSFKTADGDIKYLTKVDHREECIEHSKSFLIETDNIKETLKSLQKAVASVQDSILSLATSGRLGGKKDNG